MTEEEITRSDDAVDITGEVTALSEIYLLLFTMQKVLRLEYGWTTFGDEKIQKKSLVNILN